MAPNFFLRKKGRIDLLQLQKDRRAMIVTGHCELEVRKVPH
jgi:hypothetical protein